MSPIAELLWQISYIIDDDDCVLRLLRYAKRINAQRTTAPSTKGTPVVPARVAQDIVESIKDIKENEGASFVSWEQLKKEMHDEG